MNKIFFLCIACFVLAGCENDHTEGGKKQDFAITLTNITATGVDMHIVPKSNDLAYFSNIISAQDFKDYHNSSVTTYIDNLISDESMWGDNTQAEFIAGITKAGITDYNTNNLAPNTDYVAFAIGLDTDGTITTRPVSQKFKTAAIVSDNTFEVTFANHAIDGVDITIKPSNDDRYFYTIMPKVYCDQYTDDELLEIIFRENSMTMEYFAVSGEYTYENENVWDTDTGYYFFVFGYDSGVATTRLNKFSFRTKKPDSPAAGCTFSISVPEDEIKIRTATVYVAPSDKTVMYLWDLIDKPTYDQYKDRMDAFVTEYTEPLMQDLYKMFERDDSQNTFNSLLEANTTYYVWAACIDEYGKPASAVAISAPFTTKDYVKSPVTVEMVCDKYYDGEALYALNPEKYPESNKPYAYVPVWTVRGEGEAAPKLWYCNVFNEDLSDPQDPTDAEVYETLVANSGGLWCMVSKPFLIEWDKPVTFLAVALDANENYSVFRAVHTFTKSGVSDPSTLTDPANAPSVGSFPGASHPQNAAIRQYRQHTRRQ